MRVSQRTGECYGKECSVGLGDGWWTVDRRSGCNRSVCCSWGSFIRIKYISLTVIPGVGVFLHITKKTFTTKLATSWRSPASTCAPGVECLSPLDGKVWHLSRVSPYKGGEKKGMIEAKGLVDDETGNNMCSQSEVGVPVQQANEAQVVGRGNGIPMQEGGITDEREKRGVREGDTTGVMELLLSLNNVCTHVVGLALLMRASQRTGECYGK
ncbi:hypothetical protein NDU88_002642 [Pleurodeles waltl]|uniref:Uncharacterized protein n=1 Tax=Pleurodeles waltl TaxID=8319 RepID=A0AAV7UAC4_PLEWA|nr:hypothetical protein NDU88_002642 [Pleurodeles waltl]